MILAVLLRMDYSEDKGASRVQFGRQCTKVRRMRASVVALEKYMNAFRDGSGGMDGGVLREIKISSKFGLICLYG